MFVFNAGGMEQVLGTANSLRVRPYCISKDKLTFAPCRRACDDWEDCVPSNSATSPPALSAMPGHSLRTRPGCRNPDGFFNFPAMASTAAARLTGKVALVTGAGSGIGRASALASSLPALVGVGRVVHADL